MKRLLLIAMLSTNAAASDVWVDVEVPVVSEAQTQVCTKLVNKAKRGAIWRQAGLVVMVAMANTHTTYVSSTVRVNGQTHRVSGSVTYSDAHTANDQLDSLTPYAKRLSKKMAQQFADAGCDTTLYYGAQT